MNKAGTTEGSSPKEQENGDASNESERPLKKARFAWQVKGKYHLKNDTNEMAITSTSISPAPEAAETSGSGSTNHNRGAEQNIESLGDYLMKQDFNTLDSVIVTPDQSLPSPSTSMSNDKPTYPRYASSCEQNRRNNTRSETRNTTNDLAQAWISQLRLSEEGWVANWQTKQLLQCFVDNSINRVLDTWMQTPQDETSRAVVQGIAEFINNFPGVNSIEDEGILMAISAHGLQQPATASSSTSNNMNILNREEMDNNNIPNREGRDNNNIPNMNDHFYLLTPLPSDDESHEQENNIIQIESDSSSNDSNMSWFYTDPQKYGSSDIAPFPLFPEGSSLSYQNDNDGPQNSIAECDGNDNNIDDNCAFLDEAILFAIQSKGLTTIGSDYG